MSRIMLTDTLHVAAAIAIAKRSTAVARQLMSIRIHKPIRQDPNRVGTVAVAAVIAMTMMMRMNTPQVPL